MSKRKRFRAHPQGMAEVLWCVDDTKTSRIMLMNSKKPEAIALAKELNKFSFKQLRNDLADWLWGTIHT